MFRIGICEDDEVFSSRLKYIIAKKFSQYDIYRGIVVNLYHIDDFIDDKSILSNKKILYVARRRLTIFKKHFLNTFL